MRFVQGRGHASVGDCATLQGRAAGKAARYAFPAGSVMRRVGLAQLLRFAAVGGTVAALYVGLFAFLRAEGLAEGLANTIAFAAAICVQYIGQTVLTFREPLVEPGQMLRFGLTVGLGYVVAAIITSLAGPALGWADWFSAGVVAALLPVQNFIIFRVWVYASATA